MNRFTPHLVTVITLATTAIASACPLCKDSIPSSDAQAPGGIPAGFNHTIYLMLGGLVCVLGMVTFTLVKGARGTSSPRDGRGFPLR
jgi:hypothetical protein